MGYCSDCQTIYTSWSHGCFPRATQLALELRSVGYREPSVLSPTYPFLPVTTCDS